MKKALPVSHCASLLATISARGTKRARILDKALIVSLLLSGGHARLWAWGDLEMNLRDLPYAVFDAIKLLALSKRILIAPFNYTSFRQSDWEDKSIAGRPIFSVSTTPLTTQEVTRRIKRYGRIAGIPSDYLNLRTLSNTHQALLRIFGDGEAVAHALGLPTIWKKQISEEKLIRHSPGAQSEQITRDPRLHGIGRRRNNLLTSGR